MGHGHCSLADDPFLRGDWLALCILLLQLLDISLAFLSLSVVRCIPPPPLIQVSVKEALWVSEHDLCLRFPLGSLYRDLALLLSLPAFPGSLLNPGP